MLVEKLHSHEEITQAFKKMSVALDGCEGFYLKKLINKTAEIWRINNGESYAITAIELDSFSERKEFVVCCYEGKDVKEYAEYIQKIAVRAGCQSIRCHIKRKGLAKILQSLDWNLGEMIYKRGL